MFTGIIEELGTVGEFERYAGGAKMRIGAATVAAGAEEGDSISVNGVCLTALEITPGSFAADVSDETLARSTLGNLKTGSKVNLERAVTPSTRLGGHIVQGHVDGRGKLLQAFQEGEFWTVRISYPKEIGQYLVHKGSVAVEGISLTIANLTDEHFDVAIIPKTWQVTNLSSLNPGDEVNLEADVIAKYVERIMRYGKKEEVSGGVTMELLAEKGFA